MRFMTLIKSAENMTVGPPPPELFQAIARLSGEGNHWNGWQGETEVRQLIDPPQAGEAACRG